MPGRTEARRGAPAVTENLVLASSLTGNPATGIALLAMDAGLALQPVARLLSAPPNLSETTDLSASTAGLPTVSGRTR